MKLIETKVLTGAQSTVEFINIPQVYTDLKFIISARSGGSDSGGSYYTISVNGGSSYASTYLQGNGSSSPISSTLAGFAGVAATTASAANIFSNDSIYLFDYTSSQNKIYLADSASENNASNAYMQIICGTFNSSSGITTATFTPSSGQFQAGTTFSLYGILKGSDGITTVS